MYHELVHSPSLHTLLQLEQTFSANTAGVVSERDRTLAKLQKRQISAMDRACGSLGAGVTDVQINELAGRHIKETAKVEAHFENEIRLLQTQQRKDYREFVQSVFSAEKSATDDVPKSRWRSRDVEEDELGTAKEDKGKSMFGMAKSWTKKLRARQGEEPPAAVQVVVVPDVPEDNEPEPPRLQESFTVQLGTQQKAQHNMRLLSASALHLCRIMESGRGGELPAERLSTAMSLYSQSLHGVVLLVDKGINSFTGIKKEFGALCEKSTDFHFPSLEEQLKQLHVDLMNAPTPVLPEEDEGAKPRPPSPSAELKHGVCARLRLRVLWR